MSKTKIEWTDATWNPIRARRRMLHGQPGKVGWYCQRVSEGCRNCYAARMNDWRGTGVDYAVDKAGQVELFLDEKMLVEPLRWRKPRMIFVCSMTDLFGAFVLDGWIDRIFAVMALAEQHTFQVLTKRPERMSKYFGEDRALQIAIAAGAMLDGEWVHREGKQWRRSIERIISLGHGCDPDFPELQAEQELLPLPNVWLGTSVENQATLDERAPFLMETPAAVRWISYEPALGPIDLSACVGSNDLENRTTRALGVSWIVVGGESGPGARPMREEWARSVMQQCRSAGIPFFMKQGSESNWLDYKDFRRFPFDLQIREYPFGRLLDGRTWDQMPDGPVRVAAGRKKR